MTHGNSSVKDSDAFFEARNHYFTPQKIKVLAKRYLMAHRCLSCSCRCPHCVHSERVRKWNACWLPIPLLLFYLSHYPREERSSSSVGSPCPLAAGRLTALSPSLLFTAYYIIMGQMTSTVSLWLQTSLHLRISDSASL